MRICQRKNNPIGTPNAGKVMRTKHPKPNKNPSQNIFPKGTTYDDRVLPLTQTNTIAS